jgi:hypothetical protein
MSSQPQYEFSQEENSLIGSLASKMSFVGLFFVVVGVINLLMAGLLVVAIYRSKIPDTWVNKLPADAKKQVEEQAGSLPPNNQLWGMTLNLGVVGVFYLLMGVWTRSAAASFKEIVQTQGRDISHLMRALSSLRSMYALLYMLLVITLLLGLALLGLALYQRFAA